MRRTNTFVVRPRSDQDAELLHELLDASASLWNELTYERRQNYFDGESIWDTADYRKQYVGVLGSATAQQLIRKNKSAWNSFFSLTEKGKHCSPPGYWGNEDDGRTLRTYIRNDQYTLELGDRSRLEIPVGKELKDKYDLGYTERLRLEVAGVPKWGGKQGRLELYYDESSNQFRAFQPVTVDDSRLDAPLASEEAALDIGANSLVACTTTTGQQYLYHGRDLFEKFRDTTREISRLQSKLREGRYSSNRIRQLYRGRRRRRDHAQNALVRDLLDRLYEEGVSTVYVGDLTDVLETHWSIRANAKTHNFWAFRAFIDRLACTAEEYGITVELRSEAWTTRTCPNCGSTTDTIRHQDTLTCSCGFEGHADLVASESFLRRHQNSESSGWRTRHTVSRQRHTGVPRPMARPVRFEWDSHEWLESPRSHRPKEARTDQSIHV
ncbi:RNA-guided endonuclease InsQ/TnpB family protein [Haloarchaeobius litoreus]|uniref:RNA-guided endonuclease InsQ/TnpB family protein n=1 Tax=Haloarchaeobius litoreus TaxID=755306 RepID=A0ABD6DJ77_9EURY|nr:transposase [Haloarchaeobius litoreus]